MGTAGLIACSVALVVLSRYVVFGGSGLLWFTRFARICLGGDFTVRCYAAKW